ncbi:MAG: hypothetical protein K6B73_06435 [Treponema sp.]|nr:hypothetical protein [Treponema sp.]
MFAIIKCTFYAFVVFMLMMVISGVKDYHRPVSDGPVNYNSWQTYERIHNHNK